eukprot:scaffold12265_cov18-Tisochrysis_lutea.AAC.3
MGFRLPESSRFSYNPALAGPIEMDRSGSSGACNAIYHSSITKIHGCLSTTSLGHVVLSSSNCSSESSSSSTAATRPSGSAANVQRLHPCRHACSIASCACVHTLRWDQALPSQRTSGFRPGPPRGRVIHISEGTAAARNTHGCGGARAQAAGRSRLGAAAVKRQPAAAQGACNSGAESIRAMQVRIAQPGHGEGAWLGPMGVVSKMNKSKGERVGVDSEWAKDNETSMHAMIGVYEVVIVAFFSGCPQAYDASATSGDGVRAENEELMMENVQLRDRLSLLEGLAGDGVCTNSKCGKCVCVWKVIECAQAPNAASRIAHKLELSLLEGLARDLHKAEHCRNKLSERCCLYFGKPAYEQTCALQVQGCLGVSLERSALQEL